MTKQFVDLSDPEVIKNATDEEFAKACIATPWVIQYQAVCNRMNNEQFEAARAAAPYVSLVYAGACGRMNDEQFELSRAAKPWIGLCYPNACQRMTDEQFMLSFNSLSQLEQKNIIDSVGHAAYRLELIQSGNAEPAFIDLSNPNTIAAATDAQFERARALQPYSSLTNQHACNRMTDKQFEASRSQSPGGSFVNPRACKRMTDEQFEASRVAWPLASFQYPHAFDRMTDEQILLSLGALDEDDRDGLCGRDYLTGQRRRCSDALHRWLRLR